MPRWGASHPVLAGRFGDREALHRGIFILECQLKVLIGMETSRRTRDAFLRKGHTALSCDLLPTDAPGPHYQGDVRDLLAEDWDLVILHPDCTYLTSSGLHWNNKVGHPRYGGRQTAEALDFVRQLIAMTAHVPRVAFENPQGCIGTQIRPADQYIQPYQFGDDASKKTGLWLKGLPLLRIDPRARCPGRWVVHNGKRVERWANQTDSGQNRLGPSDDRWKLRSMTYPGIAEAFTQWAESLSTTEFEDLL